MVLSRWRCCAGTGASGVVIRPLDAGRACRGEASLPAGWVGSGWKIQARYMPAAWVLISERHAWRRLQCGREDHLVQARCETCS